MNKYLILLVTLAFLVFSASAQTKTNDAISRQIKTLRAEKTISLSYDQNSNVSKLMAVTDNFDGAGSIGIQAMNFAIGFMYSGQSLAKAPEDMILTFWVLTKKPRFAANHNLSITGVGVNLDLGAARYVSRTRDNMEYLNFKISRENLAKIAGESNARIQLGEAGLRFTSSQLKAISDILILSDSL
ncbi:MAG: hypothetical protein ABIU09_08405 [Pyrinomonadaceae bacterium]